MRATSAIFASAARSSGFSILWPLSKETSRPVSSFVTMSRPLDLSGMAIFAIAFNCGMAVMMAASSSKHSEYPPGCAGPLRGTNSNVTAVAFDAEKGPAAGPKRHLPNRCHVGRDAAMMKCLAHDLMLPIQIQCAAHVLRHAAAARPKWRHGGRTRSGLSSSREASSPFLRASARPVERPE